MFRLFPRSASATSAQATSTPTIPRPAPVASTPPTEPPAELSKYVARLPRTSMDTNRSLPAHPWLRAVLTEPPPSPPADPATVVAPSSSQKVWGPIHWNLLHTLAEKLIDDAAFLRARGALMGIVQNVCSILPCPKCVAHATEYLAQVQWQRIATRADWIEFVWLFHNFVNWRTKQIIEPREVLAGYADKSTADVIRAYFVLIYKPMTFAYHTNLNHGMVRETAIKQIRQLLASCHDSLRQ